MNKTEIGGNELKQYIGSSKSVIVQADACLIPSSGRISFDFGGLEPAHCDLHMRRVSGNGKITIDSLDFSVLSKSSNVISVNVGTEHKIEISRPNGCIGDVSIFGISLYAFKEESQVSLNWKDLIRRCGKYSCLRMTKGRLFASTGGFLEKGYVVTSITTKPAFSYKRDGNKIVFPQSCEITDLVVSDSALPPPKLMPFSEREAPNVINVAQPQQPVNRTPMPQAPLRRVAAAPIENFTNHIRYDSSSAGFNQVISNNKKLVKPIRSSGKQYLLIKQSGMLHIPMAILQPNTEYICVLRGKTLNGNGKALVGLSTDASHAGNVNNVIFTSHASTKYISIKTQPPIPGAFQKLHIMRPGNACTGELLIDKIMIIDGLGVDRVKGQIDGFKYIAAPPSRVELPHSTVSLGMSLGAYDDIICATSQKYARHFPEFNHMEADQDYNRKITVTSAAGASWFNKIKPVFPNVQLLNASNIMSPDSLCISHAGFLRECLYTWIEPFDLLTGHDINKLNKAKIVFSPSEANVQTMKNKLVSNVDVRLCRRPLFYPQPTPIKFFDGINYVLVFNRNPHITERLIASWEDGMPKMVLVGVRGKYPDFVIPFNEYMPFSNLVYLMQKAECIVDLPSMYDYESSLLHLAMHMGIPVASTNWFVLDKPNCKFIISDDKYNNTRMPSVKNLIDGVKAGIGMPNTPPNLNNYNLTEMMRLKQILSAR